MTNMAKLMLFLFLFLKSTFNLKIKCNNSFTNDKEKNYYVPRINIQFELGVAELRIAIIST